jgi:hypothetical protein
VIGHYQSLADGYKLLITRTKASSAVVIRRHLKIKAKNSYFQLHSESTKGWFLNQPAVIQQIGTGDVKNSIFNRKQAKN